MSSKANKQHVCGFLKFSDIEYLVAGMTTEQRASLTDEVQKELDDLVLEEFGSGLKGRKRLVFPPKC